MPIARFEMPDGRIARFEVPDGTTPEQAQSMISAEIARIPKETAVESQPQKNEGSVIKDIAGGYLKGLTDIGSTLLAPVDAAARAVGIQNSFIGRDDRREAARQAIESGGADPSSMAFKGSELATDIAGTAGAGGVIGKALKAVPGVAGAAPKIISAIESGGFNLGAPAASTVAGKVADAGIRAIGGATMGGASAGLIDPNTAGTGAAIGAVVPGGAKLAGMVGRGIKNAAGTVARNTAGAMTGTGSEAVRTAFQAGKTGNRSFLDNMRGNVDMTDVLDDAKTALGKIREERAAAYRSGMMDIKGDKSIIPIGPIEDAVSNLKSMGSFKGQVINKNASGVVDELSDTVGRWAKLDPAEYHTPEGLDALKQAIGDIRDGTQYGTAARRAADQVYNSVKKQIQTEAKTYAKVMRDYSEASDLISEVERSLVGKEKTSVDTAMRKLQSLMRNNVNTNYGNRLNLAQELEKRGANIMPAIAGQAMSSVTPRGLQGVAATGAGIYGLTNPAALAALPFQSPRLMGELSYGLGRMSGVADNAATSSMGLLGQAMNGLPSPAGVGLLTSIPAVSFSR